MCARFTQKIAPQTRDSLQSSLLARPPPPSRRLSIPSSEKIALRPCATTALPPLADSQSPPLQPRPPSQRLSRVLRSIGSAPSPPQESLPALPSHKQQPSLADPAPPDRHSSAPESAVHIRRTRLPPARFQKNSRPPRDMLLRRTAPAPLSLRAAAQATNALHRAAPH